MPTSTADRVIAALKRDPGLMWDVARGSVRVLGPWKEDSDDDGVFWERAYPHGAFAFRIAEILDNDGRPSYSWTQMDVFGDAVEYGYDFDSFEAAARDVDAQATEQGFTLVHSTLGESR